MTKAKKTKIFLAYLLISFILGSVFFKVENSPDAYTIKAYGLEYYNEEYAIENMRPLQYVITKCTMSLLGEDVEYELIYSIYLAISLVLLALSMYLVYTYLIEILANNAKIPKLTKTRKRLIFICIIFMFFNRYVSDNLIYLENLTMMLALFLAVVASVVYTKNLRFKNIIVFVLLVISEFSYQTMITSFVVLSLLFYALKSDKKITLKYLLKLSVHFLIPLFLLFGFSKIVESNGVSLNSRFTEQLSGYIPLTVGIGIFVIIYCVNAILCFFVIGILLRFTDIDKGKKYIKHNLMFITFAAVIYTHSFAFINYGYLSNRMAICIGMISSIICLFVIVYRNDVELKGKKYSAVILLCLVVELVLFYGFFGIFVMHGKRVENNSKYVLNYIESYNSTNEEKIENIAMYKDENITKSKWYSIVPYLSLEIYNVEEDFYGELIIFGLNDVCLVDSSDEVFAEYFEGKDWDKFSDEEFVVIGNTLHFCKF